MPRSDGFDRDGVNAVLARARGSAARPSRPEAGPDATLHRHRLDDGGALSRPGLGDRGAAARRRASTVPGDVAASGRGFPPHAPGDLRRQRSRPRRSRRRLERGGALPDRRARARPHAGAPTRRQPLPSTPGLFPRRRLGRGRRPPPRGDRAARRCRRARRSSNPSFTSIVDRSRAPPPGATAPARSSSTCVPRSTT